MFSMVVRRVHMYLALFLGPWVVMYALSTMVMNHREVFVRMYGAGPASFEKVREVGFAEGVADEFAKAASAEEKAVAVLRAAGLEGAHSAPRVSADGGLVVQRLDAVRPYRVTYVAGEGKVVVERARFQWNSFMGSIHRRRGYQQPYALDDAWGAVVDLFIVAAVLWALSGLWMWWEMRVTRKWGAVALAVGVGLFAFFLVWL